MATIVQHIPNFFHPLKPDTVEFHTQSDLLEIPFVKHFRLNIKGEPDELFYRYSLDDNKLLVELRNEAGYFVIGYITGTHNLHLPKWGSNDKGSKK